jgi:hypothetical protein
MTITDLMELLCCWSARPRRAGWMIFPYRDADVPCESAIEYAARLKKHRPTRGPLT